MNHPIRTNYRSWTSAGACALLLLGVGCASLDASNVEEARRQVDAARSDGRIDATRSIDMQEAERHLALAESALDKGKFQDIADHEALMASTYAQTARAEAAAADADRTALALLDSARRKASDTRLVVERAVARAQALRAEQTERGLVLTLGGVLFAFDSAELKPAARHQIARVAGFLIALDDREVLVEGHTDNKGTEEYNLELSMRRAASVKEALVADGVAPGRVTAEGYGPAYPVASNDDEAGRERNRRVEVIILESGRRGSDAKR